MKKLYPLFIALVLPFLPRAQDLYVKGLVTVEPNGLLHVRGNVEIDASGTLDIKASGSQHGVVEVQIPDALSPGTWIGNGMTIGGGDVKFLGGDVDYTVSGSNVSFPNLILNFGAPVGGVIANAMTLNNNITITKSLNLTKGKIITGTSEAYIADSAANAITGNFGAEKSRYIEGTLRREIRLGSDKYYRFPIGQANVGYNPVTVDLRTTAGVDGAKPANVTSLTAKFVEAPDIGKVAFQYTTHGDCYFTAAQQYLEFYGMVRDFGYWSVEPNDTVSPSPNWNYDFYCFPNMAHVNYYNPGMTHMKIFKAPKSVGTPGPTFDWNPFFFESGNPCNGVNLTPDSMYWFPGEYIPVRATDSIAAWNLSSFSNFGLGGGTGAGLPIELLYLRAYPVDNRYIKVEWATATEINNRGFDVLRSVDGVNFSRIGWRDGAGNSSSIKTYDFPDVDVVPNVLYYYRLRQIDFDGTDMLTYIVTAMINESFAFTISEFIPNPSSEDSRIEVRSDREKDLDITVYNTLGQVLSKHIHRVVPGSNAISFDFNNLADGTYYAIIKTDNEFYNRKLILTK